LRDRPKGTVLCGAVAEPRPPARRVHTKAASPPVEEAASRGRLESVHPYTATPGLCRLAWLGSADMVVLPLHRHHPDEPGAWAAPVADPVGLLVGVDLEPAEALTQLVRLERADGWVYATCGALALAAVLLASAAPAFRAARIDPVTVLRGE
jgi:hypothetical protein